MRYCEYCSRNCQYEYVCVDKKDDKKGKDKDKKDDKANSEYTLYAQVSTVVVLKIGS